MNKLHFTTKPFVIREQLLFAVGAALGQRGRERDGAQSARAQHLHERQHRQHPDRLRRHRARPDTTDAWSFGIVFSINTSGSQVGYAVGFNARNVLGTGMQLQFQYGQNPTRDSVLLGVTKRLIFGSKYDLGVLLSSLSDGTNDTLSFGLPFRTLDAPKGWTLGAKVNNGRVLQFYGGDPGRRRHAAPLLPARVAQSGDLAHGSTDEKLPAARASTRSSQRNDFQPYSAPTSAMPQTFTAAFGPYLAFGHPKFHHVRFYQAGGRVEDLQLGYTGTVGLYFAPADVGLRQQRDRAGAHALGGAGELARLLPRDAQRLVALQPSRPRLRVRERGLHRGLVPRRRSTCSSGTWAAGCRRTATRARSTSSASATPCARIRSTRTPATGCSSPPPSTARSSGRTSPSSWRSASGVFVDHAGAWYDGSAERTGTDVGAGLRFGSRTCDDRAS